MKSYGVVTAMLLTFVSALSIAGNCRAATPDKYTDGKLTVEWTKTGDNFTGTITLGQTQYPATAHSSAEGIAGSFTAGTHSFPFTASLNGDTLTFVTGPKQYILKNAAAAVNPLAGDDQAAPANPLAATSLSSDAPAGYAIVSTSDFGKAMSTQKATATSVQAALEATLADLTTYFGAKPTIGSAYQDAKNPKSGGATFSSALNGQPVKGIISCKIGDKGATVAVIYARADTPKAEWDKLTTPPKIDAASTAQANAPAQPAFALKEFDFPDGTGSLELADGWTTPCQTCINPIGIKGPAQQNIILNNMVHIDTPDSPNQQIRRNFERSQQQFAAQARAMGRPYTPPPAPPVPPQLVSPYLEPVDALKTMMPQFNKVSQFNHGPTSTLDSIVSVKDAPSALPNGKGAIILYTYTQTLDGQTTQFKRSIYLQTVSQGQSGWLWLVTGVAAPASTFAKDAPLMFAMMNSLKVNQAQFTQRLNEQTQTNIHNSQVLGQAENAQLQATAQIGRDNMNTQNQIYNEQHQAQMDSYHQHNEQWAADETAKQQRTADFIETIQGTRTIYDTQTGAVGSAELTSATSVVDSLNQAALDPNRFVQVPLRDYLYAPTPVPSR